MARPSMTARVANAFASVFRLGGGLTNSFEAAGNGRRLRGFNPSKNHVNVAIRAAGSTLVARARWLYENDGYAGNAIDEWTSAAVGDGIKPRPRMKDKKRRAALLDLFWRWTEEADAEGLTDYYGLQQKVAREAYMAGECFVRIRSRRPSDMWTVPFQLQMLPTEMLDQAFSANLPGGNFIRQGIEFDAIGRRVAYHFWRYHPHDERPPTGNARDRVRVPAAEVIHVFDGRQGGQIRGVPRVARVLVKIFGLEVYDDAELERKKTASLFTGFLTGRGENPLEINEDPEAEDDDAPIAGMEPGAIIDLGMDRDIKFSSPTEVGGSYEAFQYRNSLKISAGLGVPYSYVTGDMTKGNFSNVRTGIVAFRRRVSQWQNHTLIFQLCRAVWIAFVERAVMAGKADLPDYDKDPTPYWACEHLPPRQEWIDPAKDIKAEKEAISGGLKSRTQSIAERGYDREDMDDEIEEERVSAKSRAFPLVFDTDGSASPVATPPGAPANDDGQDDAPTEEEKNAA